MEIAAIVALGNPGISYAATRHNVGVWLQEALLSRSDAKLKPHKSIAVKYAKAAGIIFVRSTGYMNTSGVGVGALLRYYKVPLQQVLVLHDELDLQPGVVRLKQSGGDGGHNGLKSIISHLNGSEFWRLRVGIGRPKLGQDVSSFVLGMPSIADALAIRSAIKSVVENFNFLERGDAQAFMRILHKVEKK